MVGARCEGEPTTAACDSPVCEAGEDGNDDSDDEGETVGPTELDVAASDFPFHKLGNPDLPGEGAGNTVVRSFDDVMSSMGVSRAKQFVDIPTPGAGAFLTPVNGVAALAPDIGTLFPDPVPVNQGLRRIEPRNTPTFHGAAFNFDNFWYGRARFAYNGGSVFGPSDPTAHIFIDPGAGLVPATNGHIRPELLVEEPEMAAQPVRIKFSSLASQAMGPPLSDFEMSFFGRNWAKIGKKLLQAGVRPLANQLVDPTDSVLGPYSNQRSTIGGPVDRPGTPGLNIDYVTLIKMAFAPEYWANTGQHFELVSDPSDGFDGVRLEIRAGPAAATNRDQFNQMEANFSLFFGLAVQMFEQILIPDDTPFDRFLDANPLEDIGNVGRIAGVMVRGRWLSRADIDAGLKKIEQKNPLSPSAGRG